ncbi:pentatricopeptide repeat-containing protein MRL1, chloroplastic isoform X2 [Vitis riparia]|uniref:pentatricopeptide repeat-containing protein MRL1, chloroplastic isoform X2 n=1 Tax=Vitis riparia TaxID=96939 RepID=UPI00155ACD8C|nr:pentatricopeptide repeat-containing protein MRL1, chloroplastic isoform X2 [Vitis riparia]
MDVNFSAKSQALTLISCTPLYSSPSPSSSFCTLRREFLGCGHNLRPPGLRSPKKCKNLRFRVQSPSRFYFKASLGSQPVLVVVAVAAVFAFSVVFLSYSRRRKNSREVSGPSGFAISQLSRDVMNQFMESAILGFGDLHKETSEKESRATMDIVEEVSHASKDKEAPWQEIALMQEETHVTNTSESSRLDVLSSNAKNCVSVRETEEAGPSILPPLLSESGLLQPLVFATEMPELHLEEREMETEFGYDLSTPVVQTKSIAASVPDIIALEGVNERKNRGGRPGEESEIISFTGIFRDTIREELYTFYEAKQSVMKPMPNFNGIKTLASNASLLDGNGVSFQMRNATSKEAELSAQNSHSSADYVEGKMSLSCYKEGSSGKRNDLVKGKGFPRDKNRRLPPLSDHRNLSQFPLSNGMTVKEKYHDSEKFSAYNRLLSEGRLSDCIQLLEDMEKMGLLDMDKVYHAKFFKICRSQKAVTEAFRFAKLIPTPTLSTFNMLMSVCATSQDSAGAFQVLQLVREAGLKADCKLYTTLISTCAKSGKVDAMFEVFHEMVNAEVEPNVHTYGALIDGCGRAGQVAKAFGAYGIMRSKKVEPDRVVFNALITACGQSGAVDRAFDVLAEMRAETQPIDPDHITVGALIKACTNAGQVDRAREVYKMIDQYNIKGTPEVYTIAVNSHSQIGDWEFAYSVYTDMTRKGVVPDEAKNWQKALELYVDIKSMKLNPTVSTMNALITALCEGEQLEKAMEVLSDMKRAGLCPNTITYSILLVASEKKDDIDVGLMILSQARKDSIAPNLVMCRCLVGMCLRRFEKACALGEPVLSFNSGRPQIDNKWTSSALMVYRETVSAGVIPTMELLSQVLGCLQFPRDVSLRNRLIENLGVSADASRRSNLCSLIDGFGEYDSRAFSLLEEAASLGVVSCVSFKKSPVIVDTRRLQIRIAEVYLLTVLKGLKHRLAAGAKLPSMTILLPTETTQVLAPKGEKAINLAGRISQAVASMLRRLGLPYQGNESRGKIRINGLATRRWCQPKLAAPFSGKDNELSSSQSRLGTGISLQQRKIRTGNLSLD